MTTKPPNKPKRKASFVMLDREMMDCPAYITAPMEVVAAVLLVGKRENGRNNGRVPLSVEDATDAANANHLRVGRRGIKGAIERGFLTLMKKARHGGARGRLAAEYRLNSRPMPDGSPPTKLYLEWRPAAGSREEERWNKELSKRARAKATTATRAALANGSTQAESGAFQPANLAGRTPVQPANLAPRTAPKTPDQPAKLAPLKERDDKKEEEEASRTHARAREGSAKQIAEPSSSSSPSGKEVERAASPYPEYAKALAANDMVKLLGGLGKADLADPYLAAPKICIRLAGHGAFTTAEELAELADTDLAIAKDWLAWKPRLSGYAIDEPMARLVRLLGDAEKADMTPVATAQRASDFQRQLMAAHNPFDWPTDA
jgi:hypothetical protein